MLERCHGLDCLRVLDLRSVDMGFHGAIWSWSSTKSTMFYIHDIHFQTVLMQTTLSRETFTVNFMSRYMRSRISSHPKKRHSLAHRNLINFERRWPSLLQVVPHDRRRQRSHVLSEQVQHYPRARESARLHDQVAHQFPFIQFFFSGATTLLKANHKMFCVWSQWWRNHADCPLPAALEVSGYWCLAVQVLLACLHVKCTLKKCLGFVL